MLRGVLEQDLILSALWKSIRCADDIPSIPAESIDDRLTNVVVCEEWEAWHYFRCWRRC